MSDEIVAEIVQEFSLEEQRRQLAFELAVPYIVGEESPQIRDVLQICAVIEEWFRDGKIPPPKHKLKVVSDEK